MVFLFVGENDQDEQSSRNDACDGSFYFVVHVMYVTPIGDVEMYSQLGWRVVSCSLYISRHISLQIV